MGDAVIDLTPAGPQHVLDGCQRVPDKTMAERRWNAPKRSTKPEREAGPLFSDDAAQLDIIDAIMRTT
jgi:hypothetical protein